MPASLVLNMIVRNEAHIVGETLACVTPHVDYWVVVDTGSTDGTQEVIRSHFERAGIPGELHERPWRDFGTNRTEALALCRGRGDYVWVIDADDVVRGALAFPELEHDVYLMKYGGRFRYWRRQVFKNDLGWRYKGVIHEYPVCGKGAFSEARIEGDYHIDSRRLGDRNRAEDKYERDRRILEKALEGEPDNGRYVFYLAQSCFDMRDFEAALEHYRRRASMGGWGEEVYYSLLRAGMCAQAAGRPWQQALAAYIEAHQSRPTRAEALVQAAVLCRAKGRFDLAYDHAKRASAIPCPESDALFVFRDVYDYRALDELAIAAYYTGRHRESYELNARILEQDRMPESERPRIVKNRDFSVDHMREETALYPEELVRRIQRRAGRRRRPRVTLTITSCKRLELFKTTVNSFLRCCGDLDRIERWICVDDGSAAGDREEMERLYPFFEFVWKGEAQKGHARSMNIILDMLEGDTWVHLEDDWHFFDERDYVSDGLEILGEDERIGQALFNMSYGETPEDRSLAGGHVKRTAGGLRYRLHEHIPGGTDEYEAFFKGLPAGTLSNVWWPHYSLRPSVMRTAAIRDVGRYSLEADHFELDFATRYTRKGYMSAFLDLITCVHTGMGGKNAYELNEQVQFKASGP